MFVRVCKCRQNLFEWQNDKGNMFWDSRFHVQKLKQLAASEICNQYIEREWSDEDDACYAKAISACKAQTSITAKSIHQIWSFL